MDIPATYLHSLPRSNACPPTCESSSRQGPSANKALPYRYPIQQNAKAEESCLVHHDGIGTSDNSVGQRFTSHPLRHDGVVRYLGPVFAWRCKPSGSSSTATHRSARALR